MTQQDLDDRRRSATGRARGTTRARTYRLIQRQLGIREVLGRRSWCRGRSHTHPGPRTLFLTLSAGRAMICVPPAHTDVRDRRTQRWLATGQGVVLIAPRDDAPVR